MPLVPRFEESPQPYSYFDRNMCIWREPEDYMQTFLVRGVLMHPFADLRTLISSIQDPGPPVADDEFQLQVDVLQFKAAEILLKVAEDGLITIEAKHDEREDEHGYISRHFVRKYNMPKAYDLNQVHSKLSFDGVLTISAPKKENADSDESDDLQKPSCSRKHSDECAAGTSKGG